jgi:Fe2+ transport system protein B
MTNTPVAPPEARTVVVVGEESVGKSQLVSSLAGRSAGEANFRGSTVTVERYRLPEIEFIDTPGILRQSDTETTRLALATLGEGDTVLLVVHATHLDEDLNNMLPLVLGKRGMVVVTFWDKLQLGETALETLERISADAGVPFVPVDARHLVTQDRDRILSELANPTIFRKESLSVQAGWQIEPEPGWLEHRVVGPLLAILLLILPALATIFGANRMADLLHPIVAGWMDPLVAAVDASWPAWARIVLTATHGDFGYGILNMAPFLLVWALPTVLLFALILAAYKASGLIERINITLHPVVRPFGLTGRDVVRVMMGFGCNVPAVISTRSCSGCSRGSAVSAIAFGSACSYQLPATLAVLAAAGAATGTSSAVLTLVFLGYLLLTTLVYLRVTSDPRARSSQNTLMKPGRPFMQWPTLSALWREAAGTVHQFLLLAMPVFGAICVAASLLAYFGILDAASSVLGPTMRAFDLPSQAALPIVLASIRKDGVFLLAANEGLAFPMTAAQALTAVYLAGVFQPCLVTSLTIWRETGWAAALRRLARQGVFAILFAMVLAWGGMYLL